MKKVLKDFNYHGIHCTYSNDLPDHLILHTWRSYCSNGGRPAVYQSCQKEMSNILRGIIEKAFLPLSQPACIIFNCIIGDRVSIDLNANQN